MFRYSAFFDEANDIGLRLCSIDQKNLKLFDYIYNAQIDPSNPNVLALTDKNGTLKLYDFNTKNSQNFHILFSSHPDPNIDNLPNIKSMNLPITKLNFLGNNHPGEFFFIQGNVSNEILLSAIPTSPGSLLCEFSRLDRYDYVYGSRVIVFSTHSNRICCFDVEKKGSRALVAGDEGGILYLWRIHDSEDDTMASYRSLDDFNYKLQAHDGPILAIHHIDSSDYPNNNINYDHPNINNLIIDSGTFASAGVDRKIRIWKWEYLPMIPKLKTYQTEKSLNNNKNNNNNNNPFYQKNNKNENNIYESPFIKISCIHELRTDNGHILSLSSCLLKNHYFMGCGTSFGTLYGWELPKNDICLLEDHTNYSIESICFWGKGKVVVTGDDNGSIRLYSWKKVSDIINNDEYKLNKEDDELKVEWKWVIMGECHVNGSVIYTRFYEEPNTKQVFLIVCSQGGSIKRWAYEQLPLGKNSIKKKTSNEEIIDNMNNKDYQHLIYKTYQENSININDNKKIINENLNEYLKNNQISFEEYDQYLKSIKNKNKNDNDIDDEYNIIIDENDDNLEYMNKFNKKIKKRMEEIKKKKNGNIDTNNDGDDDDDDEDDDDDVDDQDDDDDQDDQDKENQDINKNNNKSIIKKKKNVKLSHRENTDDENENDDDDDDDDDDEEEEEEEEEIPEPHELNEAIPHSVILLQEKRKSIMEKKFKHTLENTELTPSDRIDAAKVLNIHKNAKTYYDLIDIRDDLEQDIGHLVSAKLQPKRLYQKRINRKIDPIYQSNKDLAPNDEDFSIFIDDSPYTIINQKNISFDIDYYNQLNNYNNQMNNIKEFAPFRELFLDEYSDTSF